MREMHGDLWALAMEEATLPASVAVCVTTNGDVNNAYKAIMGRGVALQAKTRYPGVEVKLANHLLARGNHVVRIEIEAPFDLLTFPVKHHWYEEADPILIARSAEELEKLADQEGYDVVLLPRPGCGNGRLDWADVKPLLDFLDDRFWAVDR